ncbi:MAG: hypothetical protein K6A38_09725 [Lachnospiraceae bacterium]|nr:hypothetical protein [Lachnospiraceae bacterium]
MSLIPSIEVNFDNLKKAKETMDRTLTVLNTMINEDLAEGLGQISKMWDDVNGKEYCLKMQQIVNMLSEIENAITLIVDEIEKEAVTVFDAELFGRGLAINRSY